MTKTFRHSAGFGKRMEHWIVGRMLKEGLDVYLPLVDDDAIDAVIRKKLFNPPLSSLTSACISALQFR